MKGNISEHIGGKTLTKKILCYGYYWSTVNQDVADYAKRCDKYQMYTKVSRALPMKITHTVSPRSLTICAQILSIYYQSQRCVKYVFVAVDCFTKWAEAKQLATVTTKKVIKFIVRNIICCFGLPRTIVTDNGTQFDSTEFKDFCRRYQLRRDLQQLPILKQMDKLKL